MALLRLGIRIVSPRIVAGTIRGGVGASRLPSLGLRWSRGKEVVVRFANRFDRTASGVGFRATLISANPTALIGRGYVGSRIHQAALRQVGEAVSRTRSRLPRRTGRLRRSARVSWDMRGTFSVMTLRLDVPYSLYAVDDDLWASIVEDVEGLWGRSDVKLRYKWRQVLVIRLDIDILGQVFVRYARRSYKGESPHTSPLSRYLVNREIGEIGGARFARFTYEHPRPGRV